MEAKARARDAGGSTSRRHAPVKKSAARFGGEAHAVAGTLPTGFHDVTSLMEVELATWRDVVEAAGSEPEGGGSVFNNYPALWQFFTATALGTELVDALEVIYELGNETGRELLAQAADDQQCPLNEDDQPARELAARVWVESRTSTRFAEVLVRARVKAHEAASAHARTYREFIGKTSRPRSTIDPKALLAAVKQWCTEHKKNGAVDVFVYEREGEWRCEVLRGDPLKRVVEIRKGRPGILNFQPAASDHLRYDPATGRLGIATRSPRLVAMYKQVVGALIANDDEFFARDHICSLKPLQQHGRALFERHRFPGILHVDVVDLRWQRGDRDRVSFRSRDCFQLLGDIGARLHEGELAEATLVITFAGGARRGRVSLKPPYEINIQAGANERLVERLLDAVGIRGAFGDEVDGVDLWSLAPFRLSETRWRQFLGPDFDRLLREQLLADIVLETAIHPDHVAAGSALTAYDVDRAGVMVGVSDSDAAVPLRTLTMSDLAGYELDVAAVAQHVGRGLELSGATAEITQGLWSLGRRTLASTATVAVFLAMRRPTGDAVTFIRDASRGAEAVVLVPRGCSCDLAAAAQIECTVPTGPYEPLLAEIVARLGWQAIVPPHVWLRDDLIVDSTRGTAWYRGVELTRLTADSHPFRFAVEVVRAEGRVVQKEQLSRVLSGARADGDVAKKAKADFLAAVKASYEAVGRELPRDDVARIFDARGGGYALVGSGRVL